MGPIRFIASTVKTMFRLLPNESTLHIPLSKVGVLRPFCPIRIARKQGPRTEGNRKSIERSVFRDRSCGLQVGIRANRASASGL